MTEQLDSSQGLGAARWRRNREHWSGTLDLRNLRDGIAQKPQSEEKDLRRFEAAVRLYATADVRTALGAMEPLPGRLVLDLGGGNLLAAMLLARQGAQVVIADLSVPRLQQARRFLERLGLSDQILCVVAAAESLPFAKGTFGGLYTKSVLIHTRLDQAARECGRVLALDGIGTFIEPQRRNVFVRAYRSVLAPRVWRDITTYFGGRQWQELEWGLCGGTSRRALHLKFYWLGFFASVFQYAVPVPVMARGVAKVFRGVDRTLFRMHPKLQRQAWFGLMVVKPKTETGS